MSQNFLQTPFFLGDLELPHNLIYSPLAGCSDYPFRKIAKRYGAGLVYCEMVKIDALVRNDPHTYRILDYDPSMHPIGAQLCGSKISLIKESARIIEDLGFDVLDFNCGCPVDKVTKDGSGSGMLKNPRLIGDMIAEMVASVKIPVTVKIRLGWDEDSICAEQITQIAELAGAKAIAIHGRTREQGYSGHANWNPIADCKRKSESILVIANGDLFDIQKAAACAETTVADALLFSRGTMGQPWLAEDVLRSFQGKEPIVRGVLDIKKAMIDHFEEIIAYHEDKRALLDFRRVGAWYLKRCIGAKDLKIQLNRASSVLEVMQLVRDFDFEKFTLDHRLDLSSVSQ